MQTQFKCLHSGKCCEKVFTQINLTVGDIIRLAKHLDWPIEKLFDKEIIGLKPFFMSDTMFETGFGLTIPCEFRKNMRCEHYEARPLNCRLFPYWVFADIPGTNIRDFVDQNYECVHTVQPDDVIIDRYQKYKRELVKILDEESRLTDSILKGMGLNQAFDISKQNGFDKIQKKMRGLSEKGVELEKQRDELRIGFGISMIQQLTSLDKAAVAKELSGKQVISLQKLNEIEKIKTGVKPHV